MNKKIRILVADDHPIVRDGLKAILETQADFQVIGEAGNGEEALRIYQNLKPDIILMDLEMPVMDGIEAIKALKSTDNSVKIIVLTVFDTDERIISAIKSGAQGFLLKDSSRDKIFQAVRIVSLGGTLLQDIAVDKLINQIRKPEEKLIDPLTEREIEVLKAMAAGKANKQIAEELFISERTVKFHVSQILMKLNVKNRTKAVSQAVKAGIIDF